MPKLPTPLVEGAFAASLFLRSSDILSPSTMHMPRIVATYPANAMGCPGSHDTLRKVIDYVHLPQFVYLMKSMNLK